MWLLSNKRFKDTTHISSFSPSTSQGGPLQSVRIPVDRETKKQKPFAFVLFTHAESLPFAYELFRDVKLYGRPLRMQNKETGLGMGMGMGGGGGGRSYNRSGSDRSRRPEEQLSDTLSQHHRSVSVPDNVQQGHQQIHFQQQLHQQYDSKIHPVRVIWDTVYGTLVKFWRKIRDRD